MIILYPFPHSLESHVNSGRQMAFSLSLSWANGLRGVKYLV